MQQKAVLKLEFHDDKAKKKAMKIVSSLEGVESIAMDIKDKKLTVIGDIDTVIIVRKLRKLCHTDIVSVGPAKEPEKKKDEPKKVEPKKTDDKKIDDPLKLVVYPPHYYPFMGYARCVDEDPNGCVIC